MVFAAFRPTKANENLPGYPPVLNKRRLFRSSSSAASLPKETQLSSTDPPTAFSFASNVLARASGQSSDLSKLNDALLALAAIFPDVKPEVFREMLSTFSGESRLHIVAEQLMKHKAKWVNGRWRVPTSETGSGVQKEVFEVEKRVDNVDNGSDSTLVPLEEQFRSEGYRCATTTALCHELKTLARGQVLGVLAEQNYSYTIARPILLGLAAKNWRSSLSKLWTGWRKPSQEVSEKHFMLVWKKSPDGSTLTPSLRWTGDKELDLELRTTVLNPLLEKRHQAQEAINTELATLLNEQEAEQANALYECECCFSDTTFEQMATCTTGAHKICFTCIQHAVSEALYGQSWGLNIDHTRGQIACLAPTTSSPCTGCIPHALAHRAILASPKAGPQTWEKLQSRLADSALLKSQIPLVRCPFCPYAEANDLYLPHPPTYRLNTSSPLLTLLLLLLPLNFLPLLALYTLLARLLPTRLLPPSHLLTASLASLTRSTHLSSRFTCRVPSCRRASCLSCQKPWRDPHICHESATLSLRTTVEAARTAALKRTCPRCGLGFVKESGCNKMVCVCGYTMCYICRQGLGRKPAAAVLLHVPPRQALDLERAIDGQVGGGAPGGARAQGGRVVNGGGRAGTGEARGVPEARGGDCDQEGEGYRHFCQHFRPAGGKCTECDRCDLYRGENEDEIVRRAGEKAEREWREREGLGVEVVGVEGRGKGRARGRWGVQEGVDWWVGRVVRC